MRRVPSGDFPTSVSVNPKVFEMNDLISVSIVTVFEVDVKLVIKIHKVDRVPFSGSRKSGRKNEREDLSMQPRGSELW